MARVFADRVMEASTSTGMGSMTLAGAITGYRTFAATCAVADSFDYVIVAVDGDGAPTGEWETGRGTYASGDAVARNSVQASSNGNAKVNFGAGDKHIFISHNGLSLQQGERASTGQRIPRIIQKGTLRNDGDLVLPSAPIAGNTLLLVTAGWGGSINAYAPNGFTFLGRYDSNNSNAVALWSRTVQSGDGTTWAMSASDNQGAVMYEVVDFAGAFPLHGGNMASSFNGNNWTVNPLIGPFPGPRLLVMEQDYDLNWSITPGAGFTQDFLSQGGGSGNHTGAFVTIEDGFTGSISGSVSSAAGAPVYGVWLLYSKQTPQKDISLARVWMPAPFASPNANNLVVTTTGSSTGDADRPFGYVPIDGFYWATSSSAASVKVDFGAPIVVSGFQFNQDVAVSQGVWQVAGSNDDSTYTNLGGAQEWGPSKISQIIFSNITAYRYYRLTKVSGSTNNASYQRFIAVGVASAGGGGGGGKPWYWNPPASTDFGALSSSGTLPTITDDPDVGMIIGCVASANTAATINVPTTGQFKVTIHGKWTGKQQYHIGPWFQLYDPASGKGFGFYNRGDDDNPKLKVGRWSTAGQEDETYSVSFWNPLDFWFRIQRDSDGYYSHWMSMDGKSWLMVAKRSFNDQYNGTIPSKARIGAASDNAGSFLTIDYFKLES